MSTTTKPNTGYLGTKSTKQTNKFMVIDGKSQEIHDVIVHKFGIGDVDDPVIYAAGPMFDWERSEAGQFVMKHAVDKPIWHKRDSPMSFTTDFVITAKLKDSDYLVWILKYKEEQ